MSTVTQTAGRLLRLTCPCDLAAVRQIARVVRDYLDHQGLPREDTDAWELICSEAGNNAVEHADGTATRLPVEFCVEVHPAHIELRVLDHTQGFDLPDRLELPDPLAEGGRGLFLIRSLSDSLRYWRGRGDNCLVVRRQRHPGPPPPADPERSMQETLLESTLEAMTEELAASFEILAAIFRFTEELSRSGGDLDSAGRCLQSIRQTAGADWFVLRLLSDSGESLAVSQSSHPALALGPLPLRNGSPPPPSAELTALLSRKDVWFDADAPAHPADPLRALGSSIAGVVQPLYASGDPVGTLTMGRYARNHTFTAGQVNILRSFGDFLGMQIRNVRLQADNMRTQLLERDYAVASRIQRQLLPKTHPRHGAWSTAGLCESAQRVGGDFYDILEVGTRGFLLAVADVMGKGLPAALFATVFRTLLHARPDLARHPGAFIEWLNQNLVDELGELDMIITAQLAYVNFDTRDLRVAGAGHPPLLLAGHGEHDAGLEIFSSGPPLGIDLATEFGEEKYRLPPGARLLLYTDGVTEATGLDGLQLGTRPLLHTLAQSARTNDSCEETIARLSTLQPRRAPGDPLPDDRTLVLLAEDRPQP